MTPKEKARAIVNSIYQPLGLLHCRVPSIEMWNWAKERASDWVDEILNNKSIMLIGGRKYWEDVKTEIEKQ